MARQGTAPGFKYRAIINASPLYGQATLSPCSRIGAKTTRHDGVFLDAAGSYLNDIRIAPNGRFAYLIRLAWRLGCSQYRFRAGMACFERRFFDPIRSERYRHN